MIIVTKEVIITKMGNKIQFKIKIIQVQRQSEGTPGQIEGIPEGGIERKLETKMFKKSHTQQFEKLLRLYPLFNHP